MKFTRALLVAVSVVFAALAAFAQTEPGTVSALEFQTVKSGMIKQYEEGRKTKAAWHK